MENSYLHLLKDIEEKEIIPGFSGKLIHTDKMTLAFWNIKKGSKLHEHSHFHEQVACVTRGVFELVLDGKSYMLSEGMVLTIPSNMPHSGRAITDCQILDVFSPVREEYK